jgi:hypothetical protein
MLEQGEQRDRGKPAESRVRRQASEQPGRGVGERIAAGIIHGDIPALQGREHAARQRPVGRDERCGFMRRLQGLAQADGNGERLFLGIGCFDDSQCIERAFNPGGVATGELLPALGDGGRPEGLGNVPLAPVRGGAAQLNDLLTGNADATQQRLHGELGMLDRGRNACGRILQIVD